MKSSTKKSNLVEVPFTEQMVSSAQAKAKNLGKINNSILKGKGNFAGYLGEEIVANYIQAEIISNNEGEEKYNHDLIKGKKKIEVKSKRRTVPPRDYYDASVAETSAHQKPDIYIFTSIQFEGNKPVRAWVCGQKDAKEYFEQARFYAKGDIDPSNGWKVSTDCHNLPYKDLDPVGH
jgi:hypothetical protein